MSKAYLRREPDAAVEKYYWGEMRWYASGDQGNSSRMSFGKCVLLPDCRTGSHRHADCEEIIHVVEGRVRHHVAGEDEFIDMGPGDTIVVPPDTEHQTENVGNDEAELIVASSSPGQGAYEK